MHNIRLDDFVPLDEVSKLPKIGTFIPNSKPIKSVVNKRPFTLQISKRQSFNLSRKLKIRKILERL